MRECRAGRGGVLLALAILVLLCVPTVLFCVYELLLEKGPSGEDPFIYLAGLALFGGLLVFGVHRVVRGLPYISYHEEKVVIHWNGREETVVPWSEFQQEIQVGPLFPSGIVLTQRNPPQGRGKREIAIYPTHRGFQAFQSALEAHGILGGGRWPPDINCEEVFHIFTPDVEKTCVEIAQIISQNEKEVVAAFQEGLAAPQQYLAQQEQRLKSQYPLSKEEMKRCVADPWWLMRDVLEQYQVVCTRDWKDELEDFLFFLFGTKRAKAEGLTLDPRYFGLSRAGDIPEWSRLLNGKLADKGLVVGYLGTEADEYTLFLTTQEELDTLERLAYSIHQIISGFN